MAAEKQAAHVENVGSEPASATDVENYHGLTTTCILAYVANLFMVFVQMTVLIGSGAFARDITNVVGGTDKATWFAQIIVIVTAALGPPISQAANYWGRKWFMVVGGGFGFAGSIIISRATTITAALVGQVIMSLSLGTQPLIHAISSEILPRRYRAVVQSGVMNAMQAAGVVTLLGGGAMIRDLHEGFRAFWYLNAALYGTASISYALLYNPPPRPTQLGTTLQKLRRLDWAAYILICTGMTLFVMALTWADNPYPWSDARVLSTFILGVGALAALGVYETVFKKDGMFHHSLFKDDRNFALANVLMFVEGTASFALNSYFPLEMAVIFETDPVRVGLRYSVVFFASSVGVALVSIVVVKRRMLRWPLVVSYVFITLFFVLMAPISLTDSNNVWGYAVILGAGIGICLTLAVTTAQISAPPELIALTSGLVIAMRAFGAAVGLAIYTAIFNAKLPGAVGSKVAAAVMPLGLSPDALEPFIGALMSNDQELLMSLPDVNPAILGAGAHAMREGYLVAFRYIYITAAAIGVAGITAAACIIDPKDAFTLHVDAPVESDSTVDLQNESKA
ncbi:major facilitator superfamily domain-containing protein [Aspergillus keveii]|uniref:Major facilitator superfamily domain-containing protein n=1 Tax=Aspergillus keveii TaxID=714993 RepID=A0ABR4G887_9EURO